MSGSSSRAETNWVRMPGVFATNNSIADEQLQLPVSAPGINVVLVAASSYLRLTPDFDIVVWLGDRWLASEPLDEQGWVHFTYYELAQALYGAADGGAARKSIRQSILRLMSTLFTVEGIDAVTRQQNARIATTSAVITELVEAKQLIRSADLLQFKDGRAVLSSEAAARFGALRGKTVSVKIASWMCAQLAAKSYTYIDFPTLRSLDGVAKRTWVYLQAENYSRMDAEVGCAVIGLGRPALNCLGVGNYSEHRQARAALKRAAATICATDPRYESIVIHKFGAHSHQLRAHKYLPEVLRARALESRNAAQEELRAEHSSQQERARRALSSSSYAEFTQDGAIVGAYPAEERPSPPELDDGWFLEREKVLLTLVDEGGPLADAARGRLRELYAARQSDG